LRKKPPGTAPGGSRNWLRVAFTMFAVAWGANQFSPVLIVYRHELGLNAGTIAGLFGIYAAALVPGLLLGGPASDRFGRRPVVIPFVVLSPVATLLLMLAPHSLAMIAGGRALGGLCSGVVFGAATAWVQELSADAGMSARRSAVALSAGFGLGPLVAALVAQQAADPLVLPYLPHLALAVAALLVARRAPETRTTDSGDGWLRLPEVRSQRFRTVVAPLAPWVFGAVSVGVAYLPGLVEPRLGGYALIFSTLVTLLCAGAGIAAVPLARRVARAGTSRLLATALTIVVIGLVVAAAAAALTEPLLVLAAAVVLGAGYGCCQVCGLAEVQRLAGPGHLAGLTAAYQAISYLGFAASVPLAAVDRAVPPSALLLGLAALAALTLVMTTRAAPVPERSTQP
jgi:MFS family permease